MSKVNDILTNISNAQWTFTDDYSFFFKSPLKDLPNIQGFTPQEIWDMCTINIDTPQSGAQSIGSLLALEHKFWVPMYSSVSLTVTFKDFKDSELKRYFMDVWYLQQKKYYNDMVATVDISDGCGTSIFRSEKILIDNVSQTQFDNANSQIMEFSVSFSTGDYYFDDVHVTKQ
jgi:hypothetical protein